MIEVGCRRTEQFGQPSPGQAAGDFHLAQAQMGMDHSQGESHVHVGIAFNEGDLPIIEADPHRSTQGYIPGGKVCQALPQGSLAAAESPGKGSKPQQVRQPVQNQGWKQPGHSGQRPSQAMASRAVSGDPVAARPPPDR
ncbi:MAG: hypothetical protein M3Y08_15880 [Fibrobacterota bacterium]|nr:hypothetical protein [Fibrobacterota bacterium]